MFKYTLCSLIGLMLILITWSCSSRTDEEGTIDLRINHFKQTGFGPFPMLVYLTQEGEMIDGPDWQFFYGQIEGFEYKKGYLYDLKVKKESLENPPQDASAVRYILEKVISRQKVSENEAFDIKLKWAGENFIVTNEEGYSLLEEYQIDCSDLCGTLSTRLQNEEEVTGTFVHSGANEISLTSVN